MQQKQTSKMIIAALMMAMVTLMIIVFPVPMPAVNGYINLGDGIIFMAVIILGWRYGALAGGLGAALADLLLGYAVWAPFTFIIKGGMALIMGVILERAKQKNKGGRAISFVAMICAGIWMAAGYCIVGGIMYGNFLAAILSAPMDCLQFGVGAVLASVLLAALSKTPVKRHFTYSFMQTQKLNA